jgi:hypothetical protein
MTNKIYGGRMGHILEQQGHFKYIHIGNSISLQSVKVQGSY